MTDDGEQEKGFDRSGLNKLEDLKKQLEQQLGSKEVDDLMKNFPAMQMMQENSDELNLDDLKTESGSGDIGEFNFDTKPIQVNFHNSSEELPDPKYEFDSDSGFDLRNNEGDFELEPLERKIVPTGLYFSLPTGTELQIRPKSGLAAREGITVLNTPGTVDSEYRGEVKVILVNLSNDKVKIEYGDKIAQAVLNNVNTGQFIQLDGITKEEFDEEKTDRGEDGFGSTGKK